MKPNEVFLKAQKIIGEDEELYYHLWATGVTKISDHIGLRKIQDTDGQLHFEIAVEGGVTYNELEQNLPKILDAQVKFTKVQGDDLPEYFCELLRSRLEGDYIQEYKSVAIEGGIESKPIKSKPSWTQLAMDANFDLLVYLFGISQPNHSEINRLADYFFTGLLKSFSFSDADIVAERQAGLEKLLLVKPECPWNIRVRPIDREKMRLKMRRFIDKYDKNRDLILASRNTLTLNEIRLLFIRERFWAQASELLKQACPKSYSGYEKRLNARITELLLSSSMESMDRTDTTGHSNFIE